MKWKGRTRSLDPVPLPALRSPTDGFPASLLTPLPYHPLLRGTASPSPPCPSHPFPTDALASSLLPGWCWKLSMPFAGPPLSTCVPSPGLVHCVFHVMVSLPTDAGPSTSFAWSDHHGSLSPSVTCSCVPRGPSFVPDFHGPQYLLNQGPSPWPPLSGLVPARCLSQPL